MVSIEVLRSFPYFAGVSAESLKAVAAITEERAFPAGQPLFKEDDPARALYIVRAGQVDIVYQRHVDEGRVVDTVVAGDLIGWSSLVEPYRCTATAVRARLVAPCGLTRPEYAIYASTTTRWGIIC